ncbi:MAG TPA: redoxin domain-containing protein [Candidatus Manganitrophaceae bacterium]|nr:redoxin domain-containing protein [Candidatus Manganitrophaceae bacterium]
MIRLWHVVLMAGLLGLLALFYQGLWGNPTYIPPVLIGAAAPNFAGPDLDTGEVLSLDRFKGKVVVVNFWASWCVECKLEHPSLLEINKRFGRDPNFVMLGVNYQDKIELARGYLQEHGNSFRHIQDPDGKISIDYGVYGVPETFVIDQKGMIRHKQIGPIIGAAYTNLVENIIQPLLRGESVSAS